MAELIDLLLHVDRYLIEVIANYGAWIYALLFLIVFAETGLVVTPFLPGDSLLFATGALAATGALDLRLVSILLLVAAVGGDAVNYAIGRAVGREDPGEGAERSTVGAVGQSRVRGTRARVLRTPRRQGHRARPVHAHRPDVRAVCGGDR